MVTYEEFHERLEKLRELIARALVFHAVWEGVVLRDGTKAQWSLDELNMTLDRIRGFFTPLGLAMLDSALLEFAKIFDKDPRTASLRVLLREARKYPNVVPHAARGQLKRLGRELKQDRATLESLEQLRNQYLAHIDAQPLPKQPLLKKEFDPFVEKIKDAFNELSTAHDGTTVSFDFAVKQTRRDTAQVMKLAIEDVKRRQLEAKKALEASRN